MEQKLIDTGFSEIRFLDQNICLITGKKGEEIDRYKAEAVYRVIEANLEGPYGVIINRENDYSITPVQVYDVMNSRNRLKAVALVARREITMRMAGLERRLFRGEFRVFTYASDALSWMNQTMSLIRLDSVGFQHQCITTN